MKKEEIILDQLLLFMKTEVSKKGILLNQITFNFKPSETIQYFNAPNEIISDGEDLIAFKKTIKSKHHNLIVDALNIAVAEEFVKNRTNNKYHMMFLTEKGFARAKSFEVDKKIVWKKRWHYFMDKICVPLFVAIVITIVTNHLNQKNIDKEIESLKKEIIWIKEQK